MSRPGLHVRRKHKHKHKHKHKNVYTCDKHKHKVTYAGLFLSYTRFTHDISIRKWKRFHFLMLMLMLMSLPVYTAYVYACAYACVVRVNQALEKLQTGHYW